MGTQTFAQAFFQLYFRLADEDGTTLEVSVADERVSPPILLSLDHLMFNVHRLASAPSCKTWNRKTYTMMSKGRLTCLSLWCGLYSATF